MSTPNPSHLSASWANDYDIQQEDPKKEDHRNHTSEFQPEPIDTVTSSAHTDISDTISSIEDRWSTGTPLTLRFKNADSETSVKIDKMVSFRTLKRVEKPTKKPKKTWKELKAEEKALLKAVADETVKAIPYILKGNLTRAPPHGYKVDSDELAPPLDTTATKYFPDFMNTQVKVVNSDTLDAANALLNAHDLLESQDINKILVLNFANAKEPGGDWKNGAIAQEEAICYRSTLSATLRSSFYPLGERECIYSPNVIVFRENFQRGHSLMWVESPRFSPWWPLLRWPQPRTPLLTTL